MCVCEHVFIYNSRIYNINTYSLYNQKYAYSERTRFMTPDDKISY